MARVKKDAEETVSEVPAATGTNEEGHPTISWERPTGFSLTTIYTEETVAYALANGWKALPK